MATYAIGDVQGCYRALRALLAKLAFDPERDRLWFTGDLVNRGPESLEVLRFVADLGDRAVCVLGNHDLHLLAVASGCAAPKGRDTLAAILAAPDREALIDWLRRRPLVHFDAADRVLLVHAGLVPQWDAAAAVAYAAEVEAALRGPRYTELFRHMYGDQPDRWDENLTGDARKRFIVNACTRLRYCDADGRMNLALKGAPGTQPPPWQPWFALPERRSRGVRVICGHWSTLGLHRGDGVLALDTGCVWGRNLTAVRIDGADWDNAVSVACPSAAPVQP